MLDLLALDVACAHPFLTVSISGDGVRHWSAPPLANGTGLHLDMDANPHRGLWALQLDNAVRAAREPTILLAEGLACLAIARWAQLSPPSYVANIAGAYLFAPLSFSPAQAPLLRNLHPGPEVRLPFPSLVIDSRASLSIARVLEMTDIWGSQFRDADAMPAEWRATDTVPLALVAADVAARSGRRRLAAAD
ncbi:MAG: alpha/beta hydrolase [Pseudomonadota bacterium]